MIIVGIFMLLIKYEIIKLPFLDPGSDKYTFSARAGKKKKG